VCSILEQKQFEIFGLFKQKISSVIFNVTIFFPTPPPLLSLYFTFLIIFSPLLFFTHFSSFISLYFSPSCGELSAGSDSREEEESFYKKRKSQLNVIFSVLGTPVEVSS
jgi:hypothetical protein